MVTDMSYMFIQKTTISLCCILRSFYLFVFKHSNVLVDESGIMSILRIMRIFFKNIFYKKEDIRRLKCTNNKL